MTMSGSYLQWSGLCIAKYLLALQRTWEQQEQQKQLAPIRKEKCCKDRCSN